MNHIRVDFWLDSEKGQSEEELKQAVVDEIENAGGYDVKVEIEGTYEN